MFPILNKYIANELKNSKYCKENFLDEQNNKPKKKPKKKKKKAANQANNATDKVDNSKSISNKPKNESNQNVKFHDDENFDTACF